ncbi:MAG: GGDEF domain-containing protein [Acidaminococcaceae bacterium]|nr:GGDEF domain-containing protein [Acidaminococcaceae bacterium]
MSYSIVGLLAIAIQLMISHETLFGKSNKNDLIQQSYRGFLLAVLVYYITDALWGFFYDLHSVKLIYTDTAVYFAAMAASVLFWTQCVVYNLEEKSPLGKFLFYTGRIIFTFQLLAILVNFYYPILFSVDEAGGYHAHSARYATLFVQILMFLLTSIYTLSVTNKTEGREKRRYRIVGLFGLIMSLAVAAQVLYPLLPLYAAGLLLGCCMVHTFVVQDQKTEYLRELEELVQIDRRKDVELNSAKDLAFKDPLTGVKSKYAYLEKENQLNQMIKEGVALQFAVASCDVNGLKMVNDTLGHRAGDELLRSACKQICDAFAHSPVFRIGGDEFAVILDGGDYEARHVILTSFKELAEENLKEKKAVVSVGMSDFILGQDSNVQDVFARADANMYEHKKLLKSMGADGR